MKKTPQWWANTPELVKAMVGSALLVAGNSAFSSGTRPMNSPPPAAAAADSALDRRVTALEHSRAVEMTAMRWIVCRFDQEDGGQDPRECRHILKPYEDQLLPDHAGGSR